VKQEETIDFHIRWAWHKILRIYNHIAGSFGINMSVGYALLNIDRVVGTPSTKLGPIMGMEARSLTRTLKTMEEHGLIIRRPDKLDKRVMRIFLTELGLENRKIAREKVIQFNQSILSKMENHEAHQFLRSIIKINEILEENLNEIKSEQKVNA
jgi:DNA-binding MarR family transcriptional regulator